MHIEYTHTVYSSHSSAYDMKLIFRWWIPSYVVARVTWCVGYVSVIMGSLESHVSATLPASTVQENYSIVRESITVILTMTFII